MREQKKEKKEREVLRKKRKCKRERNIAERKRMEELLFFFFLFLFLFFFNFILIFVKEVVFAFYFCRLFVAWTWERRVVTVELVFYFHFAFSSVLGMGGICHTRDQARVFHVTCLAGSTIISQYDFCTVKAYALLCFLINNCQSRNKFWQLILYEFFNNR